MHRTSAGLVLLLLLPFALSAQALADRVAALADGTIRVSIAARAGVCGSPGGRSITIEDDGRGEWDPDCGTGPVRVSLRVHDGRISSAHTYVGGRWRPAPTGTTDLGTLAAARTAAELLALAETGSAEGGDLIMAATLADSATVWPTLLRIARRRDLPAETRRQAVFWLSQSAGAAVVRGLDSLAADGGTDLEVRKQAVFALSQRPADEGVPALIRVARTSRHPELRKAALFWLGQSEDPRAIALFEEILTSSP
ncbi:MAG TPA: HEAT repeat domain-containing protein [Gemmatimonadales bacterium]